MQKTILKIGYKVLKIIMAIVFSAFLIYGFFTLWDMYRTELSAFNSYDLMKYRPNIEEDEPPYLDELVKINPDTAAWVTIYGTNIDYPVMQGKTDMEYLNKKPTGGYSATGSIFLTVVNKKDFSDRYNLIYGHHMHSGAMFGDIDKFKNRNFFYNTNNCRFKTDEGVLIMEQKVYNLKVIAYVETDAYDEFIYNVSDKKDNLTKFLSGLKGKSKYYINPGETNKILALSTCDEAIGTNGRSLIICKMEKRTDPLPTREEEPLTPHRKAIGHPMAGTYWAFANLLILLMTLYLMFPTKTIIENRKNIKLEKDNWLYYSILSLISINAVVLFILTEDTHTPIQMVDIFTPAQLILLAGMWFVRTKLYRRVQNAKDKI